MNMWIKNSKLLKTYFPDFYKKSVSSDYACNDLQIYELKEKNLSLQSPSCRCYLHSSYNVDREMHELFRDTDDPEQILIIFGLGMGYCLEYIQKQHIRYRKVLILEPFNNIFREMLKIRDFGPLLRKRDVSIIIFNDAQKVMPQIMGQVMTSKKVKFLYHLSYRSIFEEIYQEISRLFMNEKRAFITNTATIDRFLNEWTENQLISLAKKQASAACLQGKFESIPAVIISAGPSLEKRIDEIKEIQDRALIIAPGTGARICNQKGIKAHIATATDSQKHEASLFKDSSIKVLVGSYRLHPEVDRVFPHNFLRINLHNDLIAQYFHRYFNLPFDIMNDQASVSSVAIELAAKLGCDPIILVGQDLCFYENKLHAGDEKDSLHELFKGQIQEATDIFGEKVHTYPSFMVIRRDMELINLKHQGSRKIINATEAGLGIPGVENQKLMDVIDHYISPRENDVRQIIDDVLSDSVNLNCYKDIDINVFYQHLGSEIDRLEELNIDKLSKLEKLQLLIDKHFKRRDIADAIEGINKTNSQLQTVDFYLQVVMPMLSQFLTYYKAGMQYNYSAKPDDPGAYLYYESNVYALTSRYLKIIKGIIKQQVNHSPGNKLYEDAGYTIPSINVNEHQSRGFTIPLNKKKDDEQPGLTLPFTIEI
ncbi:MAG: DUF115 domain-containing protein [Syntrophomonas sp.]|nr:DUF115 domain-containing protein [Syntrophomonas sp.]